MKVTAIADTQTAQGQKLDDYGQKLDDHGQKLDAILGLLRGN